MREDSAASVVAIMHLTRRRAEREASCARVEKEITRLTAPSVLGYEILIVSSLYVYVSYTYTGENKDSRVSRHCYLAGFPFFEIYIRRGIPSFFFR